MKIKKLSVRTKGRLHLSKLGKSLPHGTVIDCEKDKEIFEYLIEIGAAMSVNPNDRTPLLIIEKEEDPEPEEKVEEKAEKDQAKEEPKKTKKRRVSKSKKN